MARPDTRTPAAVGGATHDDGALGRGPTLGSPVGHELSGSPIA